jgi:hypothetical protein
VNPRAVRVFVYYRVRGADAARAIAAIAAFQTRLRASMPGLNGTLSRRVADGGADLMTLMESYEHTGTSSTDWQHDVERQAQGQLATWIVGERHVEIFEPCA